MHLVKRLTNPTARASVVAAAARVVALCTSHSFATMQLTMRPHAWRILYVTVTSLMTSLAAAEASLGHVMVLEDEPLSTIPAGKPTLPGKLALRFIVENSQDTYVLDWYFPDSVLCRNKNLYMTQATQLQVRISVSLVFFSFYVYASLNVKTVNFGIKKQQLFIL